MIIFIHNSDEQRKKIEDSVNTESFIFYDERSMKERKKAFSEKNKWGARATPFAMIYDSKNKPIKGFWSESNNVINDLINYLNV